MRCKSALTRIDALRTGELRGHEKGAVDEHLSTCRSCNASLSDVSELAGAMKALVMTPPRSCRDAVCGSDLFDRVGPYWVAWSEEGVRLIERGSIEQFRSSYTRRYGRSLEETSLPERLRAEVAAAIAGEGVRKPNVDLADATELERDVLTTLSKIPRGEVRSYSWVAAQIGRPKAVRAVASVISHNRAPFLLPCHRVVPAGGGVGEYLFGSSTKRQLLASEGVDVAQLDALSRKGIRFIGSATTNIYCFPTCRDARRIREGNRVPFRGAQEAEGKGFRPCKHCQPVPAKGVA